MGLRPPRPPNAGGGKAWGTPGVTAKATALLANLLPQIGGPGGRSRVAFIRHSSFIIRHSSPLAIYQAISFVLLGLMAIIGVTNLRELRRRRRARQALPAGPPRVSILVPARDEERTIGACVASLAAQDYPAGRSRSLVLDDRSTDRTGQIVAGLAARHPAVRLLSGRRVAEWLGWQGARLPAIGRCRDRRLAPLRRCRHDARAGDAARGRRRGAGARRRGADRSCRGCGPARSANGCWCRTSSSSCWRYSRSPCSNAHTRRASSSPMANSSSSGATSTARAGGHAAVRGQLMEDLALGLRCKRAGARLLLLDGGDLVSLPDVRRVWGIVARLRPQPPGRQPPRPQLSARDRLDDNPLLRRAVRRPGWPCCSAGCAVARWPLALGQVAPCWLSAAGVGRGLRQPAREIALFPPGAFVLSAAVLTTFWRAARGQAIEWRGRAYGDLSPGPSPTREG